MREKTLGVIPTSIDKELQAVRPLNSKALPGRTLQAAVRKRFTVSPHCPRATSSTVTSSGQVTRQVLWRAEKEDEVLMGTPVHYLTVEFQCFRRKLSANVEHEEIVDMGRHRNRAAEISSASCTSDSVSSQDGGAHLAGCLAAVDEENFLVGKSRAATQWRWAIHTTLPKRSAPSFRKVIRPKSAREGAGVNRNIGKRRRPRSLLSNDGCLSKSETARTTLVFLEPFSLVA